MKFKTEEDAHTFLQLVVSGLKNLGITPDSIADNPEGALNEIPLDDHEDQCLDLPNLRVDFDWGYEYVRFYTQDAEEAFLILGVSDESGKNEFVIEGGYGYDKISF